jgi:hypothetical protein
MARHHINARKSFLGYRKRVLAECADNLISADRFQTPSFSFAGSLAAHDARGAPPLAPNQTPRNAEFDRHFRHSKAETSAAQLCKAL